MGSYENIYQGIPFSEHSFEHLRGEGNGNEPESGPGFKLRIFTPRVHRDEREVERDGPGLDQPPVGERAAANGNGKAEGVFDGFAEIR